jgi:putative nucleotidyltransferase with HDIG domain
MEENKTPKTPTHTSLHASLRRWLARLKLSKREENRILHELVNEQERQIRLLNSMLGSERKRSAQFTLLNEVEQHLKSVLDQPVAAQLVCNAICKALEIALATILLYDAEKKEFLVLASAGRRNGCVPPFYRQNINQGVIGRAARQRRIVIVNDTSKDPDFLPFEGCTFLSEIAIPLIHHGALRGILVVDEEKQAAFSTTDVATLEIVANQLVSAWERSSYHERLTLLIQEGVKLSTLVETQTVIENIARISCQILEAQFTFVTLTDQDGRFTRTASFGQAPQMLRSLKKDIETDPLIKTILRTSHLVHLRDIGKSNLTTRLPSEHTILRNVLAFPIRLHENNIGVVLTFGKNNQNVFSENDESLARLIATQAAGALESAWLYQEVRSNLQMTTELHQMSTQVLQAADMKQVAESIAATAYRLGDASLGGILLYTPDSREELYLEIDADGIQTPASPPTSLIEQAIETGQSIMISDDRFASMICLPLKTSHHTYGALWLDIPEGRWFNPRYANNLQTLTNQATAALERSMLLAQTRQQAQQLQEAYHELELNYDKTLAALVSALDARDRETEGHSTRVGIIASRLGHYMGLSAAETKALERGGLLHDIGKIGVSDAILLKPGPLTEEEWQAMRQHPEIGARIVSNVPFLSEIMPIIRHHHEHWDGSGYPLGLAGRQIPLLARIFAVADAFDALISDRPYRKSTSEKYAIKYLQEQAGTFFDPQIVAAFIDMLKEQHLQDIVGVS